MFTWDLKTTLRTSNTFEYQIFNSYIVKVDSTREVDLSTTFEVNSGGKGLMASFIT